MNRVNNKEFLQQENGTSVFIYLSGSLISKTRTEIFQFLYHLNQHVEVSVVPWSKNQSGNMTPLGISDKFEPTPINIPKPLLMSNNFRTLLETCC